MRAHGFAGLHVHTGASLRTARLRDVHGKVFGLLLGIAVGPDGLVTQNQHIDSIDLTRSDAFTAIENLLTHFAGRFTLIAAQGRDRRVYGDAVGMNGIVYNPTLQRVAASVPLCIDDAVQDHPDYNHHLCETEGGKYTFFDTRDRRVRRMNPSCYLDLANFAETRFWPPSNGLGPLPSSLTDTYDEIISIASHSTQTLLQSFPCVLPLTGGRDSRLIAAFAGNDMHRAVQIYTHVTNYSSRQDAAIAALVAQTLGGRLCVHDRRITHVPQVRRDRMRDEFQLALGYDAAPPSELRTGVVTHLPFDALVLRGHQTDILRAVFSDFRGPTGRAALRWQVKRLMPVPYARFTNAEEQRFTHRYAAWRDALPYALRDHSTDLMFTELYYPSSVGATFPALNRNFYISPFNSRRLISLAMSIDEQYRHESLAVDDLVYRMNPALHNVPIDYETGASLDDLNDPHYCAAAVQARASRTEARAGGLAQVTAANPWPA
ncbi:hypothetical protein [Sulfitobacter brevis]|nr:hypothetical protein [Sulfitobacter brevis]